MASKKLLSVQNVIIAFGVGYLAYWLYKKQKKVIQINPPMVENVEEPKTIVLDLSNNKGNLFPNSMVRDFNATKFATTSPPMVVVKNSYNEL